MKGEVGGSGREMGDSEVSGSEGVSEMRCMSEHDNAC